MTLGIGVDPVFVTGGTGYIGRPLNEALVARGCDARALVRPGSEPRLPRGAQPVAGDAIDASGYRGAIPPGATLVHLVGTRTRARRRRRRFAAWTWPRSAPRPRPLWGRTSDISCT